MVKFASFPKTFKFAFQAQRNVLPRMLLTKQKLTRSNHAPKIFL